jgi:hypothetical protein
VRLGILCANKLGGVNTLKTLILNDIGRALVSIYVICDVIDVQVSAGLVIAGKQSVAENLAGILAW